MKLRVSREEEVVSRARNVDQVACVGGQAFPTLLEERTLKSPGTVLGLSDPQPLCYSYSHMSLSLAGLKL